MINQCYFILADDFIILAKWLHGYQYVGFVDIMSQCERR